MKKYALFIFPGLLVHEKFISEICSDGLKIVTDKFPYIPQPALIKGVHFDTVGNNHHIVNLYQSEISYTINAFNETDANIFFMHWDLNLIEQIMEDSSVGTIIFKPNQAMKHEMIGKAICKNYNSDWIAEMDKNFKNISGVNICKKKHPAIVLNCERIDRFTLIKQLNFGFKKLSERTYK